MRFSVHPSRIFLHGLYIGRRREVTLERRKAAEERKRAEELKAQVRVGPIPTHPVSHRPTPSLVPKKQRDYGGKLVVPKKLHIDRFR